MFRRKEEVYSIKEFMTRKNEDVLALSEKEKKVFFESGVLIPLAVAPFLKVKSAMAATTAVTVTAAASNAALYDKMLHAFDPLITLIQALSYPVAMVVVLGGAIMIMINQKEKGFSLMQGAGLGYVLVQMAPMVLNILVEAMKAV
jgi:2-keto-3-deoxy-galactonokinase